MKDLLITAALLVVSPAGAVTPLADIHDRAQVEAYIRACESEWAASVVTGDPASTAPFLADDYEGVSSRAEVLNRAQMLEPWKADGALVSDTVDYVRIRFPTPELAIAQGGETALAKDGTRSSQIWTDVWLLRHGRWQIVTSQDSRLAKPYQAR